MNKGFGKEIDNKKLQTESILRGASESTGRKSTPGTTKGLAWKLGGSSVHIKSKSKQHASKLNKSVARKNMEREYYSSSSSSEEGSSKMNEWKTGKTVT